MNMIRVESRQELSKIILVLIGVMVIAAGIISTYNNTFMAIASVVIVLSIVVYLVVAVVEHMIPMEVRFDKQWLMTKHLMFRKEIKTENIKEVRYYIKKESNEGSVLYYLILDIEYVGGKLRLKEKISKNDIENCKKGLGVMELFILYRFFEREYPKKAKGYWRFCGF